MGIGKGPIARTQTQDAQSATMLYGSVAHEAIGADCLATIFKFTECG